MTLDAPVIKNVFTTNVKAFAVKQPAGVTQSVKPIITMPFANVRVDFLGIHIKLVKKVRLFLYFVVLLHFSFTSIKFNMNKSTLVSLTSDSAVDCCHKMGVPDECIGLCKKKKPSLEPSRKQARPRSLARGDDGVILGICRNWLQSKVVKKCRELSSTKGIHLGI